MGGWGRILPLLALAAQVGARTPNHGFVENKGQITDGAGRPNQEVLYVLVRPGLQVSVYPWGWAYETWTSEHGGGTSETERIPMRRIHRIDMRIEGAQIPRTSAHYPGAGLTHYYTAQGAFEHVRHYAELRFESVYPGIDLILRAEAGGFKYDWVLQAGADLADIRLRVAESPYELTDLGELYLQPDAGPMLERIPQAWAEYAAGRRSLLSAKWTNGPDGLLSYQIEGAIPAGTRRTVIDPQPTLLWATYYGGEEQEEIMSMEPAPDGGLCMAGRTFSFGQIATTGAHKVLLEGQRDGFIAPNLELMAP